MRLKEILELSGIAQILGEDTMKLRAISKV
jgi:hypothetical protein